MSPELKQSWRALVLFSLSLMTTLLIFVIMSIVNVSLMFVNMYAYEMTSVPTWFALEMLVSMVVAAALTWVSLQSKPYRKWFSGGMPKASARLLRAQQSLVSLRQNAQALLGVGIVVAVFTVGWSWWPSQGDPIWLVNAITLPLVLFNSLWSTRYLTKAIDGVEAHLMASAPEAS